MPKPSLVLLIVLAVGAPLFAADIRVADFGAKPGDGIDDTAAINAALKEAAKSPGSRVIFDPGVYDLHHGPQHEHAASLVLDRLDHVEIVGHGATLMGHDLAAVMTLSWCRDVTVRDLKIDWDPLPFAGGRVVTARKESFEFEVLPPHTAEPGRPAQAIIAYDRAAGRFAAPGVEVYQTDFAKPCQWVRPNVLRVFSPRAAAFKVGMDVVVRHQVYAFNAVLIGGGERVRLEGIDVLACPGMGLYAGDAADVTVRRFNVLKAKDRWMSACADAMHFNGCRGQVLVEDCTLEGMGDDGINVHTMYLIADEKPEASTLVLRQARAGGMPLIPRVGDVLEISGPQKPLVPYAQAVVKSVTPRRESKQVVVTFTQPLPVDLKPGHTLANLSATPGFTARRVTVRDNRARGFLIQTHDVRVEDCTFDHCSAAGIYLTADADFWNEGIAPRNVVIRNCQFRGCNQGIARRAAALDMFVELKGHKLAAEAIGDVVIEGNRFEGNGKADLFIGSSRQVIVRGNQFEREPVVDGSSDAGSVRVERRELGSWGEPGSWATEVARPPHRSGLATLVAQGGPKNFLRRVHPVHTVDRMTGVRKASGSQKTVYRGKHRFEHWYKDNQAYLITARCRGRTTAFAGEQAKAVFWDRFSHYTQKHGFEVYVASLLDNHYHVVGYLRRAVDLGPMMKGIHGSVAKLVNDLLATRLVPFWCDSGRQTYFDGCLRDEKQLDRSYRYVLRQSVRHGVCRDWREYRHTRVCMPLEQAMRHAVERDAFLRGVRYRRYEG
jgi:REP element-mobilizing transposase RayT